MTITTPDLPHSAWWIVAKRTGIVLAVCICLSLALTYFILRQFSRDMGQVGVTTAIVLPILLGGPYTFYLVLQQQRLQLANARLSLIASIDSLTGCLNRGAFTEQVDERTAAADFPDRGALLVIDADDFKQVNDRFGHDLGDHALQQIAAAILGTVRRQDLVGRIGGEEFAVLLAGADYDIAAGVAERIRRSVNTIVFAPGGVSCTLSVSIGGALFEGPKPFMALYRQADQRLYEAKHLGRDRVALLPDAA